MTYQPPQNILAALLQTRKQQAAGQMPAQIQSVDMSQAQPAQLPQPMSGANSGGSFSQALGLSPSAYPPNGGGGALGLISNMAGYAPNTMFGYSAQNQPTTAQPNQNQSAFMSILSNILGGK